MAKPLNPSKSDVLIAVDPQNDFCPQGALAVPNGDVVIPLISALAQRFEHVVLTQDWHPADHHSFASSHPGRVPFETIEVAYGVQTLWPDHCVQGSHGADFHRDLNLPQAGLILRKGTNPAIDSYSAFYENDQTTTTGLTAYLRAHGIERVFLAGLATDFCVFYTAMDGRREGFQVAVVEDACRAIDLEGSLAAAMAEMRGAGVSFVQSHEFAA